MIRELAQFHGFVTKHPIGAKNPGLAWKKYLRWQLGARILGVPLVMPWLDQACLVVERGMTGATGNLYCGLH